MSERGTDSGAAGAPTTSRAPASVWEGLAAIAWALALLVGMLFLAPVVAAALLQGSLQESGRPLALGLQVAVGLWLQLPVVAVGVVVPTLLRGGSPAVALGLRWPGLGKMALVVVATVGVAVVLYGISALAGRPVPAWTAAIFLDPGPWPLLLSGLVLAVPLAEELLFRGYLFGRLEEAFGPIAAVVCCGLIFTAFHLQYEAFELMAIFTLAIALGICRWKTGSLLAPFVMHALYNLGSCWIIARELGVEGG